MITVLPERDEKNVKEYFAAAGIPYTAGGGCVAARSGEEVLGTCLYTIKDGAVTVHLITPADDILMADGVLRSALHVASQNFVFKAFYDNADLEDLLEKLCFIKDKATRSIDIDKLFKKCGCEDQ